MRSVSFELVLIIGAFLSGAQAQDSIASDPQAISLATQSIAALSGRSVVSDVTLSGNGTWNKTDGGTFKLSARGNGESRMDLTSSSGITTVIRDAQTGVPRGSWETYDNRAGSLTSHNCWTDAVWFFPALGSLAPSSNVTLSYVGKEVRNGATVYHLHSHVNDKGRLSVLGTQQLSAMDFYLNTATLLPVATTFFSHPDNNARTKLLVEIEFSSYKQMDGIAVPTHIQTYHQGSLTLDLNVVGITINSGISPSLFLTK